MTSRIPAIDPAMTTGNAKKLLDGVDKLFGVTPNVFRVAANSPATLEGVVAGFASVAKDELDEKTRQAIAIAVSELNGCDYCLSAHTALGKAAGLSEDALVKAREAKAGDPRLAAALGLARLVVEQRGHIGEQGLAEARRNGLSDAQVIAVIGNVAITTLTNYINTVAGTEIDFPIIRHTPRG